MECRDMSKSEKSKRGADPSPEGPIRRRCKAHKKSGQQCKAAPISGGTVCRVHGGSAPQVKNKAAQRIAEAADPAAAKLVEMLHDKAVPAAVRLGVIKDLLDRAGLKARDTVLLETKKWEAVVEDVVFEADFPAEDDAEHDAAVDREGMYE
ncbi:HGGxSTG domain-containing protein [Streptomyces anulatus]